MKLKTKKTLAFLLPVQIVCFKILGQFPELVEQYYSNGVYLFIAKGLRIIFGWAPFSIGDIIYALLIFICLRWLYKNRNNFFLIPKQLLFTVFAFLSILTFIFNLFWGINYYRTPLHETLNIKNTYTTEQLVAVTEKLILRVNETHHQINQNDSLKITIPYTHSEIFKKTPNGFNRLSKTYPTLNYKQTSIKKSLFSLPLTYMGFGGYLNPFTNEAQVNYLSPLYHAPLTSCHEEGHQIGYAAENETNFIGYLAAKHNDDIYFQYAANTFAVRYCLSEVNRRDKTLYKKMIQKLHYGVLENYEESSLFWDEYQNPLEPIFKYGFDLFLKSKQQDKGIKSYSYVVALLVNYEERLKN